LKAFKNAGYIVGLNLQALPYDFRLDYQENELNTRFEAVITELYANWGKKVTIFAHSFGNYQTVHNLSKMSQAKKDKMVAR
jgi:esterase/lipase superfamily enzyme